MAKAKKREPRVNATKAVNEAEAGKGRAPAVGPGLESEWVRVASLTPWKRNPRDNDDAVDGVARSIIAHGWGTPLLVRGEDDRIICGHTRRKAAIRLKQLWLRARRREREDWHADAVRTKDTGEVPVRRKFGLTEAQCDALAIADNKTGERAEWSDELDAVLADLAELGLAADTGFTDEELDKHLGTAGVDDIAADTAASPLNYQVVVSCRDEMHQGEVLAKLEADGFECRPLIT